MKTAFYTKKGDEGKSFIDKKAIYKDDVFFEFLGALDELNSFLGIVRANLNANKKSLKLDGKKLSDIILEVQEIIFKMQAETALEKISHKRKLIPLLQEKDIAYLEECILAIDKKLPPLKNFVIPGESILSSFLDYARALCRRTERIAVKFLKRRNKKIFLTFLNRLSSLLFALARYVNFSLKLKEKHPSYR